MNLPNFILIGAMKCGTTSLRYVLYNHPEVFMVYPNEPRFFGYNDKYKNGLDWYASFFKSVTNEKAIGEGSGFYSWYSRTPMTAQRIYNDLPNVKILYMVRHPIQRIISHWAWNITRGIPMGNITRAVIQYRELIEMSMYWQQINAYRKFFDDKNIKILFFEDLVSHPYDFYRDCFEFLNVDQNFDIAPLLKPKNVTKKKLRDNLILIKLRTMIDIQKIRRKTPKFILQKLKHLLKNNHSLEPNWSQEIKKQVEQKIYLDSMQFLEYCNKPLEFWEFEFYP